MQPSFDSLRYQRVLTLGERSEFFERVAKEEADVFSLSGLFKRNVAEGNLEGMKSCLLTGCEKIEVCLRQEKVPLQLFDQMGEALREIDKESLLPFRRELLSLERSCYKNHLIDRRKETNFFRLPFCEGVVVGQILSDPYMIAHDYSIPSSPIDETKWQTMKEELLALVFGTTYGDLYSVLDEMEDECSAYVEITEFQRRKVAYIFSFLEGEESKRSFAKRLSDGVDRCADGVHLILDELATWYVAKTSISLGGKVSKVLQQIKQEFVNKHGDGRVLRPPVDGVPIFPDLYYVESNTYLPLFVADSMRKSFSLSGECLSFIQEEYTPSYFEREGLGISSAAYTLDALLERFFYGGRIVLSDRYFTHEEEFFPFTKERFVKAVYENFQKPSGDLEKVLFRQDLTNFMRTYYDERLHSEYEALLNGEGVERRYFTESLDLTEEGVSLLLTLLGYLQ